MLRQFFNTQWKYSSKNDWTEQVKEDLKDFDISDEICELKGISNLRFKKLVKIKAKEFAFYSYLERRKYQ